MDVKARDIVEGIVAISAIVMCVGAESYVMVHGLPANVDQVVIGRVLGTLDALVLIIANYYFGSTRSSMQQVDSLTAIGQAAANTPIHIVMPDGSTRTTSPAQEQAAAQNHSHM